jgi:hypothetical protein
VRSGQSATESLSDVDAALRDCAKAYGDDSAWTAEARLVRAELLAKLDRRAEAAKEHAKAEAVLAKMLDDGHVERRRGVAAPSLVD